MKRTLLAGILALLVLHLARTQAKPQESSQRRPILYNYLSEPATPLDRMAEKTYADKFRVLEIKAKDGFVDARLKGERRAISDPRSMRVWRVPGKVAVSYLVTPEGGVADLHVLESTDPRFVAPTLEKIRLQRFVPARYQGVAVFSLWTERQEFGQSSRAGNGYAQDGLGLMGYRDR